MNTDPRLGLPSASLTCFWQCPGMWGLLQTLTPEEREAPPDEFIAMGNHVDKARETGNTLELTEEEDELYQNGRKFEKLILDQWLADLGFPAWKEGPTKERLWLQDPETLEPAVSGESDVHYHTVPMRHVLIVDWKLVGRNVSRAESNTQMRVLAVLKWRDVDGIESIRVALNRCMATHGGTDYCTYTVPDLQRSEYWIQQHLWLSRQPDAPLRAGPWCLHCPCKSFCTQAACYSLLPSVVASRAMPELSADTVDLAVSRLAPPDLVKIWRSSSLIEKIMDAVKARLKAMPDTALADLGIARGKPRENWDITMVAAAYSHLMEQGWTDEEIFACMKFKKEELADGFRKQKGLSSDKAAKQWAKDTLASFISTNYGEAPLKEGKA